MLSKESSQDARHHSVTKTGVCPPAFDANRTFCPNDDPEAE